MLLVEEVTADFVYIRWEGDRSDSEGKKCKVEIDRTEVQQWKDRIEKLLKESATIIRCFSKHYSGYPPEDARHLLKAFAEQEWVKLWNC